MERIHVLGVSVWPDDALELQNSYVLSIALFREKLLSVRCVRLLASVYERWNTCVIWWVGLRLAVARECCNF